MAHDKIQAIIDVGEDGSIQAYGWSDFTAKLKEHTGKRFHVTATTKRTLSQNNTWWWWMEMLAEHVGEEDKETVSNQVKAKCGFWDEHVDTDSGEIFKILRSTADASVAEMKILMEKAQSFVQEFYNFVLPEPDSQLKIRM